MTSSKDWSACQRPLFRQRGAVRGAVRPHILLVLLLVLFGHASAVHAQLFVEMLAPTAPATLTAPASVVVSARASAAEDGVSAYDLNIFNGAQIVASNPSGGDLTQTLVLGPGRYVFRAEARDNLGRLEGSPYSPEIVVVAPGGMAPSVALTAPSGPFVAPASIALSATASDSDGTVSKVEFFANGNKIGEDASAPYQLQWANVAAGSWSLTAKATDNSGVVGTSAPVAVTVDTTRIIGNVDGIAGDAANGYTIRGWSCTTGRNAPIAVHLYVGGPAGSGTYVKAVTANKASEPAVATACVAQGTTYRFEIPLTAAERQAHGNKTIHVHGISPEGQPNYVISSSGVYKVPAYLSLSRKYVYDAQQRLCKIIEPETGATIMDYDEADNLAWTASGVNAPSTTDCNRTDAATQARKVTRSYDGRNRLTNLRFPDGRGDQDWSYTPDGLPAEVATFNSSSSGTAVINRYAYNTRRQPKSETVAQPGWYEWTLAYGYDGYGNLSSLTYPTGLVVDYAPNALGQPTKAGSYASNVSYYANGAIRQFTYGNGVVHSMTQNQRQLPQTVRSVGISGYDYQYDRNGNPTRIDDLVQGANFTRDLQYDVNDRLVAAGSPSFGGDHWHRFTYDGLDNLRSWKLAGVKDYAAYVYDANNRLTVIRNSAGSDTVTLSYGVQGNLATKNSQSYDFDYGNRLRDVPGKESYRYDAHGRRVTTLHANGGHELWQYSQSGQMLFSFEDTPSQKTHEQVYLAGSLIASIDHHWPSNQTIATRYQHTDALGSPVAVSNETGQLVERTQYEPYGSPIGKTVDGIGYTGHVMDGATGLTYMQQRYYDQSVGRFLSLDPVVADKVTGANFNRYWYANNNPSKFTDPDGRLVNLASAGIGAGIGGLVGAAIEGYKQYKSGKFDGRALAVEAGKGAVVGGLIGLTGGAAAAGGLSLSAQAAATGSVGLGVGAGANSLGEVAKGNSAPKASESIKAGYATALGAAAGTALGPATTGITTTTAPAIASHPVTSLSGRTFNTVNVPAQTTVRPVAAEVLNGAASSTVEETAKRK